MGKRAEQLAKAVRKEAIRSGYQNSITGIEAFLRERAPNGWRPIDSVKMVIRYSQIDLTPYG